MSTPFPDELIRCADQLDVAGVVTELHNRHSEAIIRAKAAPQQRQNADGTWPVTECRCGAELAPARLALGRILCVVCQTEHEIREMRYGRK